MSARRDTTGARAIRRPRRSVVVVLALGSIVLLASCHVTIGCTTYRLFEPTPATGLVVDTAACHPTTPPAVLGESPLAVLLPLAAIAALAIGVLRRRRRGVVAADEVATPELGAILHTDGGESRQVQVAEPSRRP